VEFQGVEGRHECRKNVSLDLDIAGCYSRRQIELYPRWRRQMHF